MHLAKVIGTVVSTQKYKTLKSIALKVIQPCNEKGESVGDAIVACDPVHAREGDTVLWVSKREASLAIPGAEIANDYPVDATISGFVDWIGERKIL